MIARSKLKSKKAKVTGLNECEACGTPEPSGKPFVSSIDIAHGLWVTGRIGPGRGNQQKTSDRLGEALVELLAIYDRGSSGSWSAAEIQRLREIREIAAAERWYQQGGEKG